VINAVKSGFGMRDCLKICINILGFI
jgi:hypothetical protein